MLLVFTPCVVKFPVAVYKSLKTAASLWLQLFEYIHVVIMKFIQLFIEANPHKQGAFRDDGQF